MIIDVAAKINLSLNILGKSSHLHTLDSVMCSIDIFDTIEISKRKDDRVKVVVNYTDRLFDIRTTDNTAYKAAVLLQNMYRLCGMDIVISKRIPVKSGLGGSAADAAGVINAVNQLFCLGLTDAELCAVGIQVGSDVPYMIFGGFVRLLGTGSHMQKINTVTQLNMIVLQCGEGVSTKECFERFGADCDTCRHIVSDNDMLLKGLLNNDISLITQNVDNALLRSARRIDKSIDKALFLLQATNPLVISMTGSGSVCFAIYASGTDTSSIASSLLQECSYVRSVKSLC